MRIFAFFSINLAEILAYGIEKLFDGKIEVHPPLSISILLAHLTTISCSLAADEFV